MAADTTVKFFSSTQNGAPSLLGSAGSLVSLLDAVLVNGWGTLTASSVSVSGGIGTATFAAAHPFIVDGVVRFSGATGSLNGDRRVLSTASLSITFDASDLADGAVSGTISAMVAPLGWTKSFAGTNVGVYKSSESGATGYSLYVSDTTTTYASVRGYEVVTDLSTFSGAFPTTTQSATSVWWKNSGTATGAQWFVIGNGRFFYLFLGTSASATGGWPQQLSGFAFGDVVSRKAADPGRCGMFSLNSTSVTSGTSGTCPMFSTGSGGHNRYLSRFISGLPGAMSFNPIWFDSARYTVSGYGGETFPNPADNSILLTDVELMEYGDTFIRAKLPGAFASPTNAGRAIDLAARITGLAGYDRVLRYIWIGVTSETGTGGVFFDVTGPWET